MNEQLIKATLRLFKSVPTNNELECQQDPLFKDTIPLGFVLSPKVSREYYGNRNNLVFIIQSIYGLSGEKLNQSFHKSWNKIKDSSLEQLYIEQLAHYCTTYGKGHEHEYLDAKEPQFGVDDLAHKVANLEDFEMNKVWDQDYIYIPKEVLSIPEITEDIKLVIIKGYTKEELKAKLLKLLNSGIALKDDTILDIVEVANYVELNVDEVLKLKNKEVKCIMFDKLNMIPENPVEFLRFVIYKTTGATLIIKNKELIDKIKQSDQAERFNLFNKYAKQYNYKELATIFYRFKPLFLAIRYNTTYLKVIINKIRRLARKYHEPMKEDLLNNITSLVKNHKDFDIFSFENALNNSNIFRKIRLAYALKFRTTNAKSIIYKIRNGSGYATDFDFKNKERSERILGVLLDYIAKDIEPNVKDKVIYIPNYINYTLPATEKQFTGFFPSGTCIQVDNDMLFGIHWENVQHHRVDLDLSLMSVNAKYGWDGYYREGSSILFSGDMTDAQKPKGATELFYVKKQSTNSLILMVNNYNYCDEIEIPFKIIVAKQHLDKLPMNYMVDPNSVLAIADTKILQRQKILGLIVTTPESNKFYFTESAMGKSITSKKVNYLEKSRQFMVDYYTNAITLKEVLERAGAKIVNERTDCDIDLDPETLEKDTIINLLIKKGDLNGLKQRNNC